MIPPFFDSSSFGRLDHVRASPPWGHVVVTEHNQLPTDTDTEYRPLHIEPLSIWRYKAWRDYIYPYNESQFPSLSQREYDSSQNDISVQLYNRLYPALQLATIFVIKAHRFFVTLDSCPILDSPQRHYDPRWIPQESDYALLETHLLTDLASEYRIFRLDPNISPDAPVVACTARVINTDYRRGSSFSFVPVICAFCPEQMDEIESDSWLEKNEMQRASLLVSVANALVHELAHAVSQLRQKRNPLAEINYEEPIVWPEGFAELGFSFSRFLFGFEPDYSWATYLTKWDRQNGLTEPRARPLYDFSVGMQAAMDLGRHRQRFARYYIALESISGLFSLNAWSTYRNTYYLFPVFDQNAARLPWPYSEGVGDNVADDGQGQQVV